MLLGGDSEHSTVDAPLPCQLHTSTRARRSHKDSEMSGNTRAAWEWGLCGVWIFWPMSWLRHTSTHSNTRNNGSSLNPALWRFQKRQDGLFFNHDTERTRVKTQPYTWSIKSSKSASTKTIDYDATPTKWRWSAITTPATTQTLQTRNSTERRVNRFGPLLIHAKAVEWRWIPFPQVPFQIQNLSQGSCTNFQAPYPPRIVPPLWDPTHPSQRLFFHAVPECY